MIASRQPPRRRTRRVLTLVVAAGLAALAFALGVAVGEALEDNPSPGGSVTRVRTLRPLPLPPARVTVTVSS